jgi:hypothetical protein
LAEPEATGKGLLQIKTIVSVRIELKAEAEFDDEQGMSDKKVAQFAGVSQNVGIYTLGVLYYS